VFLAIPGAPIVRLMMQEPNLRYASCALLPRIYYATPVQAGKIGTCVMDANNLFLARCAQVEELGKSHQEIDLLDLAARLRQLLLDDDPLVHQANRTHQLKLTFHVGQFRSEPDRYVAILSLEDGLDPDTRPPGSPSKAINLDGFLGHKVLYVRGHWYSVRDIIKHASDAAGGVHRTDNPRDQHKMIAGYSAGFGIGGLPAAIRQLKAIARVTLKGLRPLIDAIRKN